MRPRLLLVLLALTLAFSLLSRPSQAARRPSYEPPREIEFESSTQCRVCRAAERAGLHMAPAARVAWYRCNHDPAFLMRWPSGVMRPEDMRVLPMQVNYRFYDDHYDDHIGEESGPPVRATITIRRDGNDEPLWQEARHWASLDAFNRLPWRKDKLDDVNRMPLGLHARAHRAIEGVRSRLLFRVAFPEFGIQSERPFFVERPSAALRFRHAQIDRILSGEPRWVRDLIHAQLWFERDFHYAAEHLARQVLAQVPDEPHALSLRYALFRLQGFVTFGPKHEIALKLHGWREAQDPFEPDDPDCHLHAEFDPVADKERYAEVGGGC